MKDDCDSSEPLLPSNEVSNGVIRRGTEDVPYQNGTNGIVKIEVNQHCRDENRFPKEKHKLLLACLWYFCAGTLNTYSVAVVHDLTPDRAVVKPLHDVVLDHLTPHEYAQDVSELLLLVSLVVTGIIILFHKHRWIVSRRAFCILGFLYSMRFITTILTVLPVSSEIHICSPQANVTTSKVVISRMLSLVSGAGMQLGKRPFHQCGDYIYSGHTANLLFTYLLICEYSPRRWYILHWLAFCLCWCSVGFLLYAGVHYTIDVVAAYYVTSRVFWIYHTIVNNHNFKNNNNNNGNNYICRVWWFRMLNFMEANVGGPIPNHYEPPFHITFRLTWPQQMWKKVVLWSRCIDS